MKGRNLFPAISLLTINVCGILRLGWPEAVQWQVRSVQLRDDVEDAVLQRAAPSEWRLVKMAL